MPYTIKKPSKKHASTRPPGDSLVTFEQFYEMVDEKTKADLLDGLVIRDSPAIPRHADVATWTSALLRGFVEERGLGKVLSATATVKLSPYNATEPDVFFIRSNRLSIVNGRFVDGAPDLCVEVISKSSRKHDRGRKFVLYAESGVREYWIIDPHHDTVEFFENRGGEFVSIPPDERGRLHSKILPGFWFEPKWLGIEPLPAFMEILGNIRVNTEERT